MAMTSIHKRAIFNMFADLTDEEAANSFMEHLPNETADRLATREDVLAVRADVLAVRQDAMAFESRVAEQFRDLDAKFTGKIDAQTAELRGEMHTGFATIRTEMGDKQIQTQRWLMGLIAANIGAVVASTTLITILI